MKTIFKSIMLLTVACLGFVACDNERNVYDPQSDSTPSIKYIRPTDPELADQLLTGSPMGETIAIIGSGLEGVVSILFNDVEAELNPAYVCEHSIICNVPAVMPTEITNTMTLTTGKGQQCIYDFAVEIPVPFITSTNCEWAPAGSTMVLNGSYLFPIEESNTFVVTFPGGATAEVTAFDENSISVVVPECTLEGEISIQGEYGTGMTPFKYRNSDGLFIDFEDLWWDLWGRTTGDIYSDGGVDGNYMKLVGKAADWNWDENLSLFFCNLMENGTTTVDLIPEGANPSDYEFKMEVKITAWSGLKMAMWFSGVYNEFSIDDTESCTPAQCHWAGYEGYPQGEWFTVTIPFSDFNTNKEETVTDRTLSAADMKNFCIFFFGGVADAANAGTPIELAIDNIRISKK